VVAEQHAGLVAGELPTADGQRAPVGVRVERDREVGADVGGQREQQVGGAGLLGVGERDRRERRDPARPAPARRGRR
jgi:hypothetical protein